MMFRDLLGFLRPTLDPGYAESLALVRSFRTPPLWQGELFQLPEPVIEALVRLIVRKRLLRVLELGTGFGATACVVAGVFQRLGQGKITTIDRSLYAPVNVRTLAEHCGISPAHLDVVVDPSGYIWAMGRMMAQAGERSADGRPFDLCLIDGAHEWDPDAGAFLLADRLLRPGGYMVLDDLDFRLADVPNAPERFPNRTPRQLQARQMRMVWDLLVRTHQGYGGFSELHGGRVGVARKRGR